MIKYLVIDNDGRVLGEFTTAEEAYNFIKEKAKEGKK